MTEEPLQAVKPSMRLWSIVFVGVSTLVTAFCVYYTRGMAELFAGFGADLPAITEFFIDVDAWLLTIPLSGLIPSILLFSNDKLPERQMRQLFGWTIALPVISVSLFMVVMYAMYQPIFEMGKAI